MLPIVNYRKICEDKNLGVLIKEWLVIKTVRLQAKFQKQNARECFREILDFNCNSKFLDYMSFQDAPENIIGNLRH